MRKLVDAPRKKKQWTEKEEAYLQDKWGTVSIKGLPKALGRSENAIIRSGNFVQHGRCRIRLHFDRRKTEPHSTGHTR